MNTTATESAVAYYSGPYITHGAQAADAKLVRSFVKAARKNAADAHLYVTTAYAEAERTGRDVYDVMRAPTAALAACPHAKPISKTRKFRAYESASRVLKSQGDYTTHCSTVDDLAKVVGL